MYALMGSGVHGKNGINPIVSRKIWQRYNIPRSTHGLEVQLFPESEMKKFQMHENKFSKMFQTLPLNAPNILSHILTGGTAATLIIHQRMLSLLMNIRKKNGIEAEIS